MWMTETTAAVPAVFTCAIALRFVLLLVESAGKRRILVPEYRAYAKAATASTLSRSTFFWLNPLFLLGYKRNIGLDDLDPLDPKLDSAPLYRAYQSAWDIGT